MAPESLSDFPSVVPSAAPSLAPNSLAGLDSSSPIDTANPVDTPVPVPGNDDAVPAGAGGANTAYPADTVVPADTMAPEGLDTLAPGSIVGAPTASPTTRTASESEVSGATVARTAAVAAGAVAVGLAGYLW